MQGTCCMEKILSYGKRYHCLSMPNDCPGPCLYDKRCRMHHVFKSFEVVKILHCEYLVALRPS
ncbi:hypothetical protein SCFA_660064 [anaerobic digester metagenome]|uniref:Uncharacterized protein n=1 Tax=anaerobic digester metagenome TaxID=1263854 RepID=A0A485M3D6_9ZZZZ